MTYSSLRELVFMNLTKSRLPNGLLCLNLMEHVMLIHRPMVQFSADESVACRMMTNEIQFFDPKDFTKGFVYKLRMPGIAAMQLASAPGSHVAGFVPEAKV
mgnify:CR=1 FL=1